MREGWRGVGSRREACGDPSCGDGDSKWGWPSPASPTCGPQTPLGSGAILLVGWDVRRSRPHPAGGMEHVARPMEAANLSRAYTRKREGEEKGYHEIHQSILDTTMQIAQIALATKMCILNQHRLRAFAEDLDRPQALNMAPAVGMRS